MIYGAVGEVAPGFILQDQTWHKVTLSDARGKRPLIDTVPRQAVYPHSGCPQLHSLSIPPACAVAHALLQ